MDAIDYITKNKLIEGIVKNIGVKETYRNDLVQELYLIILQYDKNKLNEIYNTDSLNFFITRIAINQYHSKTSPFWKTYRRFQNNCEDINYTTETSEQYDRDKDNKQRIEGDS